MKLFIVSKKMSTRLSSETQFYSDFEPLTNPQLIKKTLYIQQIHSDDYTKVKKASELTFSTVKF